MRVLIFALFLLFFGASCKSDDPTPPTEQEIVTGLLTAGTGTWKFSANDGVLVEGVDVTQDLFKDFTIRFTTTQLFTTGTTPVWQRTDTWKFKTGSAGIIVRGQDQKEVTIEDISESRLKLTLEWDKTTYEGGRTQSLPGKFEFTLSK